MKFLITYVVSSKDHCIKQPTQKDTLAQKIFASRNYNVYLMSIT